MTVVAVLGGGAGGLSAAAELAARSLDVRLWNRNPVTIARVQGSGRVRARGVLGNVDVKLAHIGSNLAQAVEGADVIVVCLPALAHEQLADDLARLRVTTPLVLNPGHTGGAFHFAAAFDRRGVRRPPVIETSTLTYVARTAADGVVDVSSTTPRIAAALLPSEGDDDAAWARASELWPALSRRDDVLATSLSNVNLVLHPPAAILGAAWVEATGGDFRFYADATTPAVAAVMAALDCERRAVAEAFGHRLPPLVIEMEGLGTVEPLSEQDRESAESPETIERAVSGGRANAAIMAPPSLSHRYYREDFAYGVLPFRELARAAGVPTPVADALFALADTALEGAASADGLTLERLGLKGADRDAILRVARGERGRNQ